MGPADSTDYHVGNEQQQRNGAVNANDIAGSVSQTESLMKKGSDEMDQHVRKTKGVTSDHPVPVTDDPFLFDLDQCRQGYQQPYHIEHIESHAAYFSSGGVRRHISGSHHDKEHGHHINIAAYAMEPPAFFKDSIRKVEQSSRHGDAGKGDMDVHNV